MFPAVLPPEALRQPEDAARRVADTWNLHATAGSNGQWFAARISDGTTDGAVYDSRESAISHQSMPEYCCYLQVRPYPMTPGDGQHFLDFHRIVFDAGNRTHDADTPQAIIPLEFPSLTRK